MTLDLRIRLRVPFAGLCSAFLALALVVGCNERALERPDRRDGGPLPAGLTAEQAARVVAKVGERTITLGDYAATLERMDQFDRLRYQSAERRKELLDEIIDAELLAQDAKKKKLDQTPETQQAIRQILRDALLAEAKKGLPAPADIPDEEVRAYFGAHRDDFREPERRRVAHIVVKDKETATKVVALAKKASAREWGELYVKHSIDVPKKGLPVELSGDLGIVGLPGDARGDNPRVSAEVRGAAFEIPNAGEVLGRPVQDEAGFHVVRLVGKTDAHERTLADADRSIRVALMQAKIDERERALEAELRRQFPVTIDEQALAKVEVPNVPVTAGTKPAPADGGK
ncbi:MAG TPA: peptidylprolyl isomerase [Polyangiaceae bacterium]|nr:peptidylprolyl isomerase [Polyangiaceae bacterium]